MSNENKQNEKMTNYTINDIEKKSCVNECKGIGGKMITKKLNSDLVGKKFGLLTVLEKSTFRNKINQIHWKCKCECGEESIVSGEHLKSGHTKSCGCRSGGYKHGLARTKTIGTTREYAMWNGARSHAKKLKVECSITPYDIHIPDKCPLLGIPLDINGKKLADNIPSLDRIDSRLGYTKNNIWVVSWRANRLKSSLGIDELKLMVENLEKAIIERTIHENRKDEE